MCLTIASLSLRTHVGLFLLSCSAQPFPALRPGYTCAPAVELSEKAITIQYGYIGNAELMHECFPKHSRMGTARIKSQRSKVFNRYRQTK